MGVGWFLANHEVSLCSASALMSATFLWTLASFFTALRLFLEPITFLLTAR